MGLRFRHDGGGSQKRGANHLKVLDSEHPVVQKLFAISVTLAFIYISSSLLFPIAMGGVIAVLFFPLLEKLNRKNIPPFWGASALTLGITSVFLLPSSFFIFFFVKAVFTELQALKPNSPLAQAGVIQRLVDISWVKSTLLWVTGRFPISMEDLQGSVQDVANAVGLKLTEILGGTLSHLPGTMMHMVLIVVSMFFFLVDGPRLIRFIRTYSIFTPNQTQRLLGEVEQMCRSVILASIISGVVQSLLEIVTCVLTGTPNLLVIGVLVFIGSFIPVAGSLPVTMGVAIQQFFEGRHMVAAILFIMAFVIAGLDNMIRPALMKGGENLHPMVAFVAAFGGLQTIGFLGIFLGPILASLFVVTVQILVQREE